MPAPLNRVATTPELPSTADVVVIGGGIVGVFAAYYLTRRGLKVALVEKGLIGAEQSSRNWGWCRQQNRDARELPMSTKSLDLWERFATETGEDTGFRRCGLFYLSNSDDELSGWARWRDFARSVGVTTHMLSSAEATERGRATGASWKGGVFSPTDGIADPASAAPGRCTCDSDTRRHGASVLCGPRHRHRRRQALGRRHGTWHDPHENRDPCLRRALGLLLLPPARHSVSASLGALLDPLRVPRSKRPAGRAAHICGLRYASRRWRLHIGDQWWRACRLDAAAIPLRASISANVRPALEKPRARRIGGIQVWARNPGAMAIGRTHSDGTNAHPRSEGRPKNNSAYPFARA